jgi:ABC-type antimicrobial peptide transport system permease subunit
MVLSESARIAFIGAGAGITAGLLVTRAIRGVLYGVSAYDPVSFAGSALALTFVALAASYVPARRATLVDPMVALRYE